MSNNLEELSLNAWPAIQTLLVDGWVVRFLNGDTLCANSINPLYPGSLAFEETLRQCKDT